MAPGQSVVLGGVYTDEAGEEQHYDCAETELDDAAEFAFGAVAPGSYELTFNGRISTGAAASATLFFDVCSDPVVVEGEVYLPIEKGA